MRKIEILTSIDDEIVIDDLIAAAELKSVKKESMFGGEAALVLYGSLGIATIGAVTKVVVALIKNQRSVEIEIDGIKMKNVNLDTVEKLLSEKIDDD